ncbi:MAG: hypothetical protein AAB966_00725 [Patescibacteria group bacterium]
MERSGFCLVSIEGERFPCDLNLVSKYAKFPNNTGGDNAVTCEHEMIFTGDAIRAFLNLVLCEDLAKFNVKTLTELNNLLHFYDIVTSK